MERRRWAGDTSTLSTPRILPDAHAEGASGGDTGRMTVFVATSVGEALDALTASKPPEILAGGTDLMVEVNFGRRRPDAIVSIGRIASLRRWRCSGEGDASADGEPPEQRELDVDGVRSAGVVEVGAGVTYRQMTEEALAGLVPALAQAARTVGSPQIRNAGTLGGNLATASPAGDTLPVLLALDAEVVVARADGSRLLPVRELVLGPKRSALAPGELIVAARLPARFGHQEFVKVGTRNAMVIATASVALVVSWEPLDVRVALGSVGPTPLRVPAAEDYACARLDAASGELRGGRADLERFAELVRAAARPIDDHRSSARYRRHAVGVCAERALHRAMRSRQVTLGAGGDRVRVGAQMLPEGESPSEGARWATS